MQHGIGEESRDIIHFHLLVKDLLRVLDHDRTALAEALASGLHDLKLDLFLPTLLSRIVRSVVNDPWPDSGTATDAHPVGVAFLVLLFQLQCEGLEVW